MAKFTRNNRNLASENQKMASRVFSVSTVAQYAIRRRPVGSVKAPYPSGSLFETLTCGPHSNAKISGCTRPRHLADKPLLDPVSGLWSEHKPITFDPFALDYAFASRDDALVKARYRGNPFFRLDRRLVQFLVAYLRTS